VNSIFLESSPLQVGLFIVLAFTLSIQLIYYFFIYLRIGIYKPKPIQNVSKPIPISVVICARNEEVNLERFLTSVLEQDYPDFEVIVVNDCSIDNTDMVLKRYQQQYKHLRFTTIKPDEKFSHGKKLALTVGIKAAKNEWLVLTDADCQTKSNRWLANFASNFNDSNEVVLGYGGYIAEKGILNKLIRFDAFFIALNYLGFALIGRPYMGVGRNLAYRKELFFRNKGFASHSLLHSGDDDLFVHEVANKLNTSIEISVDAKTLSNPRKTFSAWVAQKKRHLTTGPRYRNGIKLLLFLEPFSRVLFWSSGIWLICTLSTPYIIVGVLIFRLLVTSIILNAAMRRLDEAKLFLISFLYDLLSPLLYFWLSISNSFNKTKYKWN
jgi:poly-beta-1,6-N-acetyl-D-glucosamine synthase